jgi:hypothetical protein
MAAPCASLTATIPPSASILAKTDPCWWPCVHGIRTVVDSICNHWRFDDVWLDQ